MNGYSKSFLWIIFFNVWILLSGNAIANRIEIQKVNFLEDVTSGLTIDSLLLNEKFFATINSAVPNFGLTESTIWVRFVCPNVSGFEKPILRLSYPLLDEVTLFYVGNQNQIEQISFEESSKKNRIYNSVEYLFAIDSTFSGKDIYLKIKSTEQIITPITIIEDGLLVSELLRKNIFNGAYLGIVFIMSLYNLFIFFLVRDRAYLSYVTYIVFMGLTQISIKGFGLWFWNDFNWLREHESTVLSSLGGIGAIWFSIEFLRLKKDFRKTYYYLLCLIAVFFIGIVFSLLNSFYTSFSIMQMNTTLVTLSLLIISFVLMIKKNRSATFFFISWFFLLSGAIVFLLKDYGVLPFNFITDSAMQLASALEMSLLSFALADRINSLKREKDLAQKRELDALQENKHLIETKNAELEKKVHERTSDLENSNTELKNALADLKKAQVRLVESEKMVSLGQLTAGVAHEINNPINFVLSNIPPLRRDLDDLMQILNQYIDIKAMSSYDEGFAKVEKLKKDLDYDYLVEEIRQILDGIENGAERTSGIVKSLRMFSRLDESEYKKAKVSDCLESTLVVLNSKIKDLNPLITKEYVYDDEIDCYPGKLNQLFMNMISNALDAIGETGKPGELSFGVYKQGENVKIMIKDNGAGMTAAVKERLFDPFFTTKDVGKGTGLGMSITYSIIEDHNGQIEVMSEKGEGTCFFIILPINSTKN